MKDIQVFIFVHNDGGDEMRDKLKCINCNQIADIEVFYREGADVKYRADDTPYLIRCPNCGSHTDVDDGSWFIHIGPIEQIIRNIGHRLLGEELDD